MKKINLWVGALLLLCVLSFGTFVTYAAYRHFAYRSSLTNTVAERTIVLEPFVLKVPKGWSPLVSNELGVSSDDGSTTVTLQLLPRIINAFGAEELLKKRFPRIGAGKIDRYRCESGQERIVIYDDRVSTEFSPQTIMAVELFPSRSVFATIKAKNSSTGEAQKLIEAGLILHWLNVKP